MLPLLSSAFSSAESVLWFVDTFMTLFCWRCLETKQNEGVLLKQKHASRLYIARRHGALSIQQKFRFKISEISEISRAQWSCTFRLQGRDPSHRAFGYCSCKQDTKELHCWQQFCQMERDILVRPTEMTRSVKVDHLQSWSPIFRSDQTKMVRSIWCTNRNFRNFGLNGKRSWTEAPSTRLCLCLKRDIFFLRFVPSTRIRWKRSLKTDTFKNALQSGDFWKSRLFVYVWTDENGGFRTRWCHTSCL